MINDGVNYRNRALTDGKLVYAFTYLDLVTTDRVADYMIKQYEADKNIKDIAAEVNRTPEEVFLFLFDQYLRGNTKMPFTYGFI